MDQGTAKIDHDFSSGSRGFFRITRGSSYFVNSRPLGPVATPFVAVSIPATQAVLSYTHLISPSTINQTRFAVSSQPLVSEEQTGGQNTSEMLGIPNVNVDRLTSGLSRIDVPGLTSMGANDNRPAVIKMHNFQFNDNFDTVRGGHTLKLGFDVIRRRTNAYQAQWNRGQFSFSTNYTANPASRPNTGFGAADLLLGKPASILLNGLEGTRGLRQTDWGYYFQDDWKLMRKLTLNLGLRYEYYQGYPQYEVRDRMMQFDVASGQPVQINSGKYPWRAGIPPDRNNLAPRVGLALQINDATVVRAAFGVYYVATTIAIAHTLSSNPPYFLNSTVSNDEGNFAGARALTDGPLRTAERDAPGQNYRGISLDFGNPYVQQWNLALQRRLPLGHQLTMAYVGTKGTGVISQQDINQARPGDGAVAARRRWPERGSILIRQNLSHLVYHGLQATVVRRFANGLQYQAAYTWSHVIDNEDKGGEGAMGPIPFDQYWRLRSNGDTDLRQMMRVTFGYELPVGRGKPHLASANKVVNGLVGGWEVNGVLSLSAGTPLSAGAGSNSLNNGSGTYADRLRNGNLPVGQRSVDRWFDIDAFAIPGFRQWGNSGRNVLYGPGTKQFDMSIFKNFAVAEKKHIQFRAEFFNVSNTPQFNNPNASIGTANAGRISSAGAEARLQRTQREIQLALKFTF
jgi:outer membrane receptor protein involved in Fe transport